MRLVDTHLHLNDPRYQEDLPEVIQRAKAAELVALILASATFEDCFQAQELAVQLNQEELKVYCTVGIHPHEAAGYSDEIHSRLAAWLQDRRARRIVALGEIGLDYFYDHSPREVQQKVFRRQLELAYEANIPIVLHERDASADCMAILQQFSKAGRLRSQPGVCHCFSGSVETAKELIHLGFYLGFDGPITFKNSRKAPEVIQAVPIERLLVETDAPYLTPTPHRGSRNEPAYVRFVVDKMADLRGLSSEAMAEILLENTCRLFDIDI